MARSIQKLAIVGASVRGAVFSALQAGYEAVAADLFGDADLRQVCPTTRIASGYPDALADWLVATDCDGWIFTGALENHHELLGILAKLRPLIGPSTGAIRAARNPLLLQPVLREAGLSFPETVDSASKLPLDRSWLCKTYRSAGGAGVWLLDGSAARDRAEASGAHYQQFVSGVSAAATFVCSRAGATLLGVTRQLVGDAAAGAKPWHYAGSVGPLPVGDAVARQLAKLGALLSGRFQLRGLVGVDLVIAGQRAWIIEINPRYASSAEIIERMTGVSAVGAHLAACLGDGEPLPAEEAGQPRQATLHGKTILYAKRSVTISAPFFQWAVAQSSLDPRACLLGDIPAPGETIAAGQPVVTAFATALAVEYDGVMRRRINDIESRLYADA